MASEKNLTVRIAIDNEARPALVRIVQEIKSAFGVQEDMMENFEEFFNAYLAAALWSSTDESGEHLDARFSDDNFSCEARMVLFSFAMVFYSRNWYFIKALKEKGVDPYPEQYSLFCLAGHDLWLTQNGHGAGFWANDYWGCYQDIFDKAASSLSELDIIIGDDGRLHV